MTMHGDGWPKSVKTAPVVMPVGLYLNTGMNRKDRREMGKFAPPVTNTPARKVVDKDGKVTYVGS